MRRALTIAAFVTAIGIGVGDISAQTLRVGLLGDPDALDPARSASYIGRIVFAGLCDKLVDIDRDLNIVPQLATEWAWSADNLALTLRLREGVVFHDGAALDAAAAKFNLDRYKDAPYSSRKGELRPVKSVEAVDARTVRIDLSSPYAPLLAVLSDRAGMMLSPKPTAETGERAGNNPVCSGPFKFKERVAQERIVLERFEGYWNAPAIHLDRIVYLPIADSTVRLANLKSGQLDIIDRLAATDVKSVTDDPRLRFVSTTALGYYTLALNLNNGADNPVAKNPKVREALDLAIDRTVLNEVVFNGEFVASNQAEPPKTKYWNPDFPVRPRNLERARALLKEAGLTAVPFTILLGNDPVDQRVGQVIQSMASEVGFDIKLQSIEQNALIAATAKGDYQAAIVIWSGRADPDGNISIWLACDGFLNWGKWCNPGFDEALAKGRSTTVESERVAHYREASSIYLTERPHLILYHLKWLWGTTRKLEGFTPYPDGIIRVQGVKLGS